jgi:hypothetical protein
MGLAAARWWAGPALDGRALAERVERAEAALAAGAPCWKAGRRKRIHALALGGAAPDHLLKVHDYSRLPFWRRLRRGKARRELWRAAAAAAREIPTPLPLGAGELRHRGLLVTGYLLVPLVPGAVDLQRMWRERLGGQGAERAWTRALGALARRMHDAGVWQEDMAPNNFLCQPGAGAASLLAIDFERARVGRPASGRERRRALAKLERHFAGARAAARLRFLLAYAGGDRDAARSWWRALERELPRLVRRDLAHLRRGAARGGRRFTRVQCSGWHGVAARGAPLEAACAALDGLPRGATTPATRTREGLWLRTLAAGRVRGSPRTWALAQALALRALAPAPLALLARDEVACLVLARRENDERLLAELDPVARAQVGPALVVLLDRLLASGFALGSLDASGIVVEGRTGARVLAPDGLAPTRRVRRGADRHRHARAVAAALLTDPGGPARQAPPGAGSIADPP